MSSKLLGAVALSLIGVPNTAALGQPSEGRQGVATPSAPANVAAAKESLEVPSEVVTTQAPPVVSPLCCKLAALMPIDLEIVTAASSKTSHQGEQIEIRVAEAVVVDGRVVIPTGTSGYAEVIQVSHRAIGGKPGELTLGQPYLTLRGQRVGLKRLRFGWRSPADRTQQAEIAMVLVGIAGGLITGGSIDIKSGTRANAVLSADTFISIQPNSTSKE